MSEELKAIETIGKQIEGFKKELGAKADKASMEEVQAALAEMRKILDKLEEGAEEDAEEAAAAEEELSKHRKFVDDNVKKFEKQIDELKTELNIAKDNGGRGTRSKSFGQMVIDKLKEKGIKADMFKSKKDRVNFDIELDVTKAAGTMTTANVDAVGTNSIPFSLADVEYGLTRVVRRKPWIMTLSNVGSTDKMYVQWAEQANPDPGVAGATGEGLAKTQTDFDWVEKSKKVEKVTAYVKVSREALDDLDGLRNEIDTELAELVMLKVDADLLSGDGNTPNLAGILSQDTAYSAGSFAGTISDPNKFDVLRTAIAQVVAANFTPNYILLHPDDIASMDLEKGSDNHYLLPPFRSADGMVISGVRIVENTGQTVDNFTVGDFTKLNIKVRKAFGIDIGYEEDDFTKNLVTILGEMRLVSYIKSNHQAAFVSGDFTTAISALAGS